jgi:hypothetical protein
MKLLCYAGGVGVEGYLARLVKYSCPSLTATGPTAHLPQTAASSHAFAASPVVHSYFHCSGEQPVHEGCQGLGANKAEHCFCRWKCLRW